MHFKQQLFIIISAIIALLIIFYCSLLKQPIQKLRKLQIVCTTTIIADAIMHIAQNKIDLYILMGPNVDPHLYKPVEHDIIKIATADIIFYNGLHLEARMTDLFKQMSSSKTTIAISQDIPTKKLIPSPEHSNHFDPHIWFDPTIWSYAIKTICDCLQTHDPNNAYFYQKNRDDYLKKIAAMYEETKFLLHKIPEQKRILITAHDAFEYFARAYEYQVVSLQGISTASEAGTKDVQQLAEFILQYQIPVIFIETSIPQRALQAVQQNVATKGFSVHIGQELYSDALGSNQTEQGSYVGMMKYNAHIIAQELSH